MHPSAVTHPSADSLKAFGLGQLDDASAEAVMSHLDVCPECCRAVANASSDGFLERLRAAHSRSGAPQAVTKSSSGTANDPQGAEPIPTTSYTDPSVPPELRDHPQYQVVRELGRGGMGVVYLANNKLMERLEVLKVMNKALLDREGAVERFLREIRSAAMLNHPNIATAYAALQVGDLFVFAMEYVEGEDLAKVVKSRGPLPVVNACYYVHQAALGLQHAFEQGMVHRDIKPQNLMLSRRAKRQVVKVLDFGLAKVIREKEEDMGLTGAGKMLGTPDYIAPEQTLDAAHADIRADLYSLGCTLYFLLTGSPPFPGRSLFEVLHAHQSLEAKPLHLVRPEVPEELAAVVKKMMAKDSAQRYQTPVEVARALLPFVKGGVKAPPGGASRGEKAEGETSKGIKISAGSAPGTAAAEEAKKPPSVASDTLTEKSTTATDSGKHARPGQRRPPVPQSTPKQRWPLVVAVVGVLPLVLLGMWAGGAFKVNITYAILVVEVNEPNPEIYVDGERVTVIWDNGGKKAEVRVRPGTHKLEIKKDGLAAHSEEVTLEGDGRQVIAVRLERRPAVAAKPAPRQPDGPVEVPNIQIKELPTVKPEGAPGGGTAADDKGFVPLFNGRDLTGWETHPSDKAKWEVKDGILIGSGPASHLFSVRSDYQDFHFRVEAMINDGGDSGQFFRAQFGPSFPKGYEAQINATHRDPIRTGSLYPAFDPELSPEKRDKMIVKEAPHKPDEWFTQEAIAIGNHIIIKVNGKTTVDFVDEKNSYTKGRFAIQQHDPKTVIKVRKIEVKELPATPAVDPFPKGSIWKGTRTYRKGAAAKTVAYELHVLDRSGSKFNGVKFDNGPGRNRLEIEGEVNGNVITWREGGLSFRGTIDKDTIRIEFKGLVGGKMATEGDGKLSR